MRVMIQFNHEHTANTLFPLGLRLHGRRYPWNLERGWQTAKELAGGEAGGVGALWGYLAVYFTCGPEGYFPTAPIETAGACCLGVCPISVGKWTCPWMLIFLYKTIFRTYFCQSVSRVFLPDRWISAGTLLFPSPRKSWPGIVHQWLGAGFCPGQSGHTGHFVYFGITDYQPGGYRYFHSVYFSGCRRELVESWPGERCSCSLWWCRY